MKLIAKVTVFFILVKLAKSAPDPCTLRTLQSEESACDQTDYEAYKECIHNESKRQTIENDVRRKRQTPCEQNSLDSLVSIKENCQRANFDCRIKCEEDEICQSQCPVCPLNVDQLIASNNHTAGSSDGQVTIIIDNNQNHTVRSAGNATTVIRLTNIINATLPDKNLSTETGGEFGLGANANGSCCYVVHPKTCTATSNGERCHHRREKKCGRICTAKVIHVRAKQRCNSLGCRKSYVPQPKPPKCVHTRRWPYVACGQSYSSNCDGCYDHYDGDAGSKKEDSECDGCYDDGFDYGPLYRHGPVLRPYFYHVPPCYIMGTCLPYPMDFGYHGYGYGHGHGRRYYEEFDDDEEDVDFEDTEDGEGETKEPKTEPTKNADDDVADDWAVEIHKCKVVSDNGTIEIRNCTSEDISENPYAGAPPDVPFDPEDEDYDGIGEGFRIQRNANHRHAHHPRIVYVPIVEDYDMTESEYDEYDIDDETPRHRRRTRQSKFPSKKSKHRQHRKTSFVYDDDEEQTDHQVA